MNNNQKYLAMAECFAAAKSFLITYEDGKPVGTKKYICHALKCTELPAAVDCVALIESRLSSGIIGDWPRTVRGWLLTNGYIQYDDTLAPDFNVKLQDYRHAWLDSLVAEFQGYAAEEAE